MSAHAVNYKNHRFPSQAFAHAVWLYFLFPLSLRLVEERLPERGVVVSYETIRRWGREFGPAYATQRSGETRCHARCRTSIPQGPEQPGRKLSLTPAKTGTDDAGISSGRRRATLHLDLFGSPKSLRRATPETLSSGHLHSPYPRHGGGESCDSRDCLISAYTLFIPAFANNVTTPS